MRPFDMRSTSRLLVRAHALRRYRQRIGTPTATTAQLIATLRRAWYADRDELEAIMFAAWRRLKDARTVNEERLRAYARWRAKKRMACHRGETLFLVAPDGVVFVIKHEPGLCVVMTCWTAWPEAGDPFRPPLWAITYRRSKRAQHLLVTETFIAPDAERAKRVLRRRHSGAIIEAVVLVSPRGGAQFDTGAVTMAEEVVGKKKRPELSAEAKTRALETFGAALDKARDSGQIGRLKYRLAAHYAKTHPDKVADVLTDLILDAQPSLAGAGGEIAVGSIDWNQLVQQILDALPGLLQLIFALLGG